MKNNISNLFIFIVFQELFNRYERAIYAALSGNLKQVCDLF